MCGRFAFTKAKKEVLKERFGISKVPDKLQPRFNIAPTQEVYTVLRYISLLSIIPLFIIQNYVNLYNAKIDQSYKINNVFSWKIIVIMVIGGFLFIASVFDLIDKIR